MASYFTKHSSSGSATTLRPACGRTSKACAWGAGIHRVVYRDYHRLLSRVFPFGIFYTMEDEAPVVWAVVDLRRDPECIRRRLTE